ncbi:MAG: hypothetical protein HY652_02315, partial [Acidobacteria bacterium]|nr:hypothetical protein [Acidobacteriota bacterium]
PRGEEVLYRSVEQPVSDLANLRWARARCVLPTGSRALILEVGGDGAVPSYAAAWGDFVLLESKARFPESPKGL